MKKKTTTIFDTAIAVEAGYAEKKFFPVYNGVETEYAELLSQIDGMFEGDGVLIDPAAEEISYDEALLKVKWLVKRHNLKPPPYCVFKYRKYKSGPKDPVTLLMSVHRPATRKELTGLRKKEGKKALIIKKETRDESEILQDRVKEQKALLEYYDALEELRKANKAPRPYQPYVRKRTDEERAQIALKHLSQGRETVKLRRARRKAFSEKCKVDNVESIKKATEVRKKNIREKTESDFEAYKKEIQEHEAMMEQKRLVKSEKMKKTLKNKRKNKRG